MTASAPLPSPDEVLERLKKVREELDKILRELDLLLKRK